MLKVKEAREIGKQACIDKIGREFCKKHADNAVVSYSKTRKVINCYVGISDQPANVCDISEVDHLILTSLEKWPYYANCNVYAEDGRVEFLDCRVP